MTQKFVRFNLIKKNFNILSWNFVDRYTLLALWNKHNIPTVLLKKKFFLESHWQNFYIKQGNSFVFNIKKNTTNIFGGCTVSIRLSSTIRYQNFCSRCKNHSVIKSCMQLGCRFRLVECLKDPKKEKKTSYLSFEEKIKWKRIY